MIVAERKPIEEILAMIKVHKKLLILGCGECVTVCFAGGEKEVKILASLINTSLKKEGKSLEISGETVERQCDHEFIEPLTEKIRAVDAVLSMACGAGAQMVAEKFSTVSVYPALNTTFIGVTEKPGVWAERCQACGDCLLDLTAGICPIARCSKSLLNGPCGGSEEGKCEINPEIKCAWQLIYDRLKELGKLKNLEEIIPEKNWSTARDGGPRKIEREDLANESGK